MTDKSKGKLRNQSEKLKSGFSVKGKKETILPKTIKSLKLQVWKTQQFKRDKREPKYIARYTKSSSSEEEHMENALALGADEGRDKLR